MRRIAWASSTSSLEKVLIYDWNPLRDAVDYERIPQEACFLRGHIEVAHLWLTWSEQERKDHFRVLSYSCMRVCSLSERFGYPTDVVKNLR